ncbi:L-rhamnose-binding lectin SML-like isoform X1 [Festucalex cinctus]
MSSCAKLCSALLLTATCFLLTAVVDSSEQVTTCDWFPLNIHRLACDHGVIKVDKALYGRSSPLVCTERAPQHSLSNVQCARKDTVETLQKSCDGKSVCEVLINDFRTPDPCVGTFKYLQTNFTCLHAITCVACEESEAHLYCDEEREIFVYGAEFGRRDRRTCSKRRTPQETENIHCQHQTDIVGKRCNGKNSCLIKASHDLFGDPCEGTYKYLEVFYTCIYHGEDPYNTWYID